MRFRQSLSLRLILSLAIAQFVSIVFLVPLIELLISIASMGASSPIAPDDWGEYRMARLVRQSLSQTRDRGVTIEPSPLLQEYVIANPRARYAVFEPGTGRALVGSSEDLINELKGFRAVDAITLKFRLPAETDSTARGTLSLSQTPFGEFAIAVYGYRFSWADVSDVAALFLSWHTAIVIAPGILGAALLAWVIVSRGLAPLRVAAEEIAKIDVNTLHNRVSSESAPAEVISFIESINKALTSLEAGVTMQRRFAAHVAHELRTPIAIMRAHADNPDDRAFRRDMRRDIRRLQTIIEQLLATASLSIRGETSRESIDLGKTVLTLIADYIPLAIENERQLSYEPPPLPVIVSADKWSIECVLSNVMDNALRFEPIGGAVHIRVLANAVVEVEDHGPGIPASDGENIFEPFWRRETKNKGLGLGLAISKSLIEGMGGTLSIKETPGGGVTFQISIPT